MIIEDEARKLLELKQELEDKENEYDRQRLVVHNELVNMKPQQIEIDSFRIQKVDDSTQMRFDEDLLWQELKKLGLSDPQISTIIARSKEEVSVTGLIRITRL